MQKLNVEDMPIHSGPKLLDVCRKLFTGCYLSYMGNTPLWFSIRKETASLYTATRMVALPKHNEACGCSWFLNEEAAKL